MIGFCFYDFLRIEKFKFENIVSNLKWKNG